MKISERTWSAVARKRNMSLDRGHRAIHDWLLRTFQLRAPKRMCRTGRGSKARTPILERCVEWNSSSRSQWYQYIPLAALIIID